MYCGVDTNLNTAIHQNSRKENCLLSKLFVGPNQNISFARDTGWTVDGPLLPGKGQTKKKTLEHPQMVRGGKLHILSPKILLLNFSTVLHHEKFPLQKAGFTGKPLE